MNGQGRTILTGVSVVVLSSLLIWLASGVLKSNELGIRLEEGQKALKIQIESVDKRVNRLYGALRDYRPLVSRPPTSEFEER